ncbi:hypothetical protein IQ17_03108 [Bradyrhizobium daqingense]|uniref:Uncharacterized protein n=1 Tax=Bradyrhizobium daqingense TaxID=993502 RepID=A0A562LDB4_9BRAD|nr:hypothetical protein IQ17_03108 [Bradyrhizobium daqingense]
MGRIALRQPVACNNVTARCSAEAAWIAPSQGLLAMTKAGSAGSALLTSLHHHGCIRQLVRMRTLRWEMPGQFAGDGLDAGDHAALELA